MSVPSDVRVFGPSTERGPAVLTGVVDARAVAVLTSAFVTGDGASDPGTLVKGLYGAVAEYLYTVGDETSVQIEWEASLDGGSTWGVLPVVLTPNSSGVSELWTHKPQFTAANVGSAATVLRSGPYVINCLGADRIRPKAQATGGTPTGTLGIRLRGLVLPVAGV